jgi:hypothetical protein
MYTTGWKESNPVTPSGIEPATFRFISQRLNHCATAVTMAQDGGKVVSLRHRPPLAPRKYSWYSFMLEVVSTPGP